MASQGKPYTLCGFSRELDWRPLNFVDPIPAHRICDACGLVHRITVFLPCRHLLCKRCYGQCLLDSGLACPLDGDEFLEGDAQWGDFPLENLLTRKVKCWNEEHGCNVVLAASELNVHFQDCDHHSTSCPRCSKIVLCCDVRVHLRSKCRDYVVSLGSGVQEIPNNDIKAMMLAMNASIDVKVGEIKNRLDQVVIDNGAHCCLLNETSHCVNSIKETLLHLSSTSSTFGAVASSTEVIKKTLIGHDEKLQQLAENISNSNKTLKKSLEDAKRSVDDIKENSTANVLPAELSERLTADSDVLRKLFEGINMLKETFGKELQEATRTICRNCVESVASTAQTNDGTEQSESSAINKQKDLAFTTINTKRYEFFVKRFKAMKDSAHSKGYQVCTSDKIYISGYHVSPGIYLLKEGEDVLLYAYKQLHKGVIDEFLQWPFIQYIRLTIKHPAEDKQRQFVVKAGTALQYNERPEESCNPWSYFTAKSFSLADLEGEGYVEDDKLRVVWELVPKD